MLLKRNFAFHGFTPFSVLDHIVSFVVCPEPYIIGFALFDVRQGLGNSESGQQFLFVAFGKLFVAGILKLKTGIFHLPVPGNLNLLAVTASCCKIPDLSGLFKRFFSGWQFYIRWSESRFYGCHWLWRCRRPF